MGYFRQIGVFATLTTLVFIAACQRGPEPSNEQKAAFRLQEQIAPLTGTDITESWKEILQINADHPVFGGWITDYRSHIKVATRGRKSERGTVCEILSAHELLGTHAGRTSTETDPLPHKGVPIWFHTASRGNTLSPELAKYLSFTPISNEASSTIFKIAFSNNGVKLDLLARARTWVDTDKCPAVAELCLTWKEGNTCPGDRWERIDNVVAYPNTSKELKKVVVGTGLDTRSFREVVSASK